MARLEYIANVRLPADLREALERAAQDDGRTSSNYVRKVLSDHLRKRGYLAAKDSRKPKRKG